MIAGLVIHKFSSPKIINEVIRWKTESGGSMDDLLLLVVCLCWILVFMFPSGRAKLTFLLHYTFVSSTCFKLHAVGQNPFRFLHFSSNWISSIFSSLAFPRFCSSSVTRLGHSKPFGLHLSSFSSPSVGCTSLYLISFTAIALDASHFHCWPGSFAWVCVVLLM